MAKLEMIRVSISKKKALLAYMTKITMHRRLRRKIIGSINTIKPFFRARLL